MILRRLETHERSLEKDPSDQTLVDTRNQRMTQVVIVILLRPIQMFAEPLVLFTDLFLLYQYSILYLYFEAYPIIFKGKSTNTPHYRETAS